MGWQVAKIVRTDRYSWYACPQYLSGSCIRIWSHIDLGGLIQGGVAWGVLDVHLWVWLYGGGVYLRDAAAGLWCTAAMRCLMHFYTRVMHVRRSYGLLQPGTCDVAGRHTVSLGRVLQARLRELRQFVRAESATSMSRTYGCVGLY